MIEKYKIKIFLFGGFGNNLSQINFGKLLEKNGFYVEFDDTLTQKNIFTIILGWHIHDLTYKNLNLNIKKTNIFLKFLIFSNLLICSSINKNIFRVFYEGKENMDKIDLAELKKYSYFFGYFQSPKLLKQGIRIRDLLPPTHETLDQIAVHIRGGDFLEGDRLDEKYYINSIKKLKKYDLPFKIFTNDESLSKKIIRELKINNFSFSKKNAYMDFNEIRRSKIIISGNSTFSIWSSILSNADIIFLPRISSNRLLSEYTLNNVNKSIEYQDII